MAQNAVKMIRESLLMSKAEVARKAGVSALTLDRLERGGTCRLDTMKKIIVALGYSLDDQDMIFKTAH